MLNITSSLKRAALITSSLVLLFAGSAAPLSAFADCVAPTSSDPGVHVPVGSDASAFTYNCVTGMWESAHFIYNPATAITTPKDPVVYVYNPGTGNYDLASWVFDPTHSVYVQFTESFAHPPAGATLVGTPAPAAPVASVPAGATTISNTGAGSNNTIDNTGGVTSGSTINGTGPGSNNTIGGTANNNGILDNTTSATLNNQLGALATTGNSIVIGNTGAGGAATGNAQDLANIVNLLQSSTNALDGNTTTFVANINGDVNGDLVFDPAQLGNVQPANANAQLGNNNLTLNNQTDATINNNINLAANSGDATVSGNTTAGDATSGNAQVIANIVNLINSAITSGKSFVGTININGNLNGDILLPPDLIDQLIAANVPTVSIDTTGPDSNNAITTNNGSDTSKTTNTNNLGITNTVDANATSGAAAVTENTTAGNATSGAAHTSITAFNLTGSNVVGRNAILVFVNVLGSWVGMIVNAPPGTTAAELGGGITQNTSPANNNSTTNNTVNEQINNNIVANANSGDATVSRNTTGGNARSGNADAAVNLLNVQNSSLSLKGWFGILFINVFGTWHGSFGINTSAGDPIPTGAVGGGGSAFASGPVAPVVSFRPHAGGGSGGNSSFAPAFSAAAFGGGGGGASSSISNTGPDSVNAVLAANTFKNPAPNPQLQNAKSNFARTAAIIAAFTILSIVADAAYSRRRSHKTA